MLGHRFRPPLLLLLDVREVHVRHVEAKIIRGRLFEASLGLVEMARGTLEGSEHEAVLVRPERDPHQGVLTACPTEGSPRPDHELDRRTPRQAPARRRRPVMQKSEASTSPADGPG